MVSDIYLVRFCVLVKASPQQQLLRARSSYAGTTLTTGKCSFHGKVLLSRINCHIIIIYYLSVRNFKLLKKENNSFPFTLKVFNKGGIQLNALNVINMFKPVNFMKMSMFFQLSSNFVLPAQLINAVEKSKGVSIVDASKPVFKSDVCLRADFCFFVLNQLVCIRFLSCNISVD